jgi:hypothetical protein
MAIKTISTRIKNRLDTYSSWTAEDVELLPGEIAFVKITTQKVDESTREVISEPALLMKVGDLGSDNNPKAFNDLPWLSAKAADVYAWAKMEDASQIPVTVSTGSGDTVVTSNDTLGNWLKSIKVAKDTAESASAEISELTRSFGQALEALTQTETGEGSFVTAVVQNNGKVTVTKGNIQETDIPDLAPSKIVIEAANGAQEKRTLVTKLAAIDAAISELTNKQSGHTDDQINNLITNKINALDASDPSVPNTGTTTSLSFIDSISQKDGIISATKKNILLGAAGGAAKHDDYALLKTEHDTVKAAVAENTATLGSLKATLAGGVRFLGVITQPNLSINDNLIIASVRLTDDSWVVATSGDVVIQGSKEYLWIGDKWEELGDLTRIGQLEGTVGELNAAISQIDYTGLKNQMTSLLAEVASVTSTLESISSDYLRYDANGKIYVGNSGVNEIIFDCGGVEEFLDF